jgi:glycosyltransferase involved in cell wall biosynthesis
VKSTFRAAAVIPAHNALPFVLEAVESTLAQTLTPAEIVVVDDSSSDGTGDAVERRFGERVHLVRGRFGSAAAARNAGWRASRSPWVAFLDADDLWFSEKLETAAAALEAHPEAGWFFSDGAFRTLEGELQASWLQTYAELREPYCGHPTAELFEVNFILTSSMVVRRDALDRTAGFDERMSHAEDLDLWIRLSRGWPGTASRRALVRYQHREGGLTRQVESRLLGDVTLFRRLAADAELPAALRRRARHREALAHYKLAIAALREARPDVARGHLRGAWLFPERMVAVAAVGAASLLPASMLRRMRAQMWATRGVAAPLGRQRRVVLGSGPAFTPMAASRRRS